MAWNTEALSASGTKGLVTSHNRLASSPWTGLTVREEDLVARSVLGQLAWLAAILVKEMPTAGCTSATQAAMPGSEGGEKFSMPPCRATETRRALSPPREALLPPCVRAAWRECLPPRWLPGDGRMSDVYSAK